MNFLYLFPEAPPHVIQSGRKGAVCDFGWGCERIRASVLLSHLLSKFFKTLSIVGVQKETWRHSHGDRLRLSV